MTTHFQTAAQVIRSAVQSAITPGMPIILENQAAKPDINESVGFIIMAIDWGEGMMIGIGDPSNRLVRYPGHVMFHIFLPAGTGIGKHEQLADAIGSALAWQTFDKVLFRGVRIASMRPELTNTRGNFYGVTVEASFQFDALV